MSSKSRFRPNTRRYVIEFAEDHELHGLEVTMRAMRLGELEQLGALSERFQGVDTDDPQAGREALGEMVTRLAKVLVSWNRMDEDTMRWDEESQEYVETDDTRLLPATIEGLRLLEDWEFMAILEGYMRCAVGVSPDLGKDSPNGVPSPAELPMTGL